MVGALASMETGPAAALEAMTAPTTKLVTLTITEKGYEATADTAGLGASRRPRRGSSRWPWPSAARPDMAPPVVASLDNLLDNGSILRARVLEAAERIDPALAPWIARDVSFPSSVVDRMVPAPTEQDLEDIADRLGLIDRAAVSTERHRSWIIRSVDGLAPLADVGVELVDDVAPFERRKLWLLNGPHSAAGVRRTPGRSRHHRRRRDGSHHRPVRAGLVDDTLEVAELPRRAAARPLRRRGTAPIRQPDARPHVRAGGGGRVQQVAATPAPVVAARRERALDTEGFAVVAAIWIAATAGVEVRGVRLPRLEDPIAGELRATTGRDGPAPAQPRRARIAH